MLHHRTSRCPAAQRLYRQIVKLPDNLRLSSVALFLPRAQWAMRNVVY